MTCNRETSCSKKEKKEEKELPPATERTAAGGTPVLGEKGVDRVRNGESPNYQKESASTRSRKNGGHPVLCQDDT